MSVLNIGKNREVFWDNYLIDTDKTTAFHRINPIKNEKVVFNFDKEMWIENCSLSYPCILKTDTGFRMYYGVCEYGKARPYIAICVIESEDGIHWHRPNLDIFPHEGLEENNIVLENIRDSAFVFYDTNPSCDPSEKYKAVGLAEEPVDGGEKVKGLWCWTSSDGYHFKLSHLLTSKGHFDSLNTMFWKDGLYYCFFRSFHNIIPGAYTSKATRDVRMMTSEDMFNWTEPVMIQFNDPLDIPLYTNNAAIYDRAPQLFVGFPVRYCERPFMTDNIRQHKSINVKLDAIKVCELEQDIEREALVATDCIFMCSRDGKNWFRYNEAFCAPGPETEDNWVYGDCYPAYYWVDANEDKFYMYCVNKHLTLESHSELLLYEIRKDGFACMMAAGEEKELITKPFIFEGKDLHLNFSSSAYGRIYVQVLDEACNPISEESYELFGDSIDRICGFNDGKDFSAYAGRPIRLRFRMFDAKLYSMKFE